MPLAALPARPQRRRAEALPASVIGTARIDRSGRFQHGRILDNLRWLPGDDLLIDLAGAGNDHDAALLITAAAHALDEPVVPQRHPTQHRRRQRCRHRIDARGAIILPVTARSLCGIAVGSTIVLVTEPATQRLLVRSTAVAVRLLSITSAPPSLALNAPDLTEQGERNEP